MFCSLDMRYIGQGHAVSVPFDGDGTDERMLAMVHESFQSVYQDVYGYQMNLKPEVVNLRIKAVGDIPKPKLRQLENGGTDPQAAVKGRRFVVDMIDGKATEHIVYEREKLLAGNCVKGPAIVEEPTTITPVRAGQECVVDAFGNLVIARRQ